MSLWSLHNRRLLVAILRTPLTTQHPTVVTRLPSLTCPFGTANTTHRLQTGFSVSFESDGAGKSRSDLSTKLELPESSLAHSPSVDSTAVAEGEEFYRSLKQKDQNAKNKISAFSTNSRQEVARKSPFRANSWPTQSRSIPRLSSKVAENRTPPSVDQRPRIQRESWQAHKAALKEKFGDSTWNPRKKLSPDTLEGIRALNAQYPETYTTEALAEEFKVSAEAIRRILKSKWGSRQPPEKMEERRERWARRHDRIWDQQAEIGLRPKRRTERTVETPDLFDEDMKAREILRLARSADAPYGVM